MERGWDLREVAWRRRALRIKYKESWHRDFPLIERRLIPVVLRRELETMGECPRTRRGLGVERRTHDVGIREITTHEFDLHLHFTRTMPKFHTMSIYKGTPLVSGTCIG